MRRLALCSAFLGFFASLQADPTAPLPQKKKPSTSSRSRTGKRTISHRAKAPSYQLRPDSDRYMEIQKALAERGYYKGSQNGEWNDDSTDALRRFQADQKITDDGHINALSLSALGLGPRHDASSSNTTPHN